MKKNRQAGSGLPWQVLYIQFPKPQGEKKKKKKQKRKFSGEGQKALTCSKIKEA